MYGRFLKLILSFGLAMTCAAASGQGWSIPGEYAAIQYTEPAMHNAVARLGERLDSGELRLEYRGTRGYLDSLLAALDIDPASQVLVFSATSLQKNLIDGAKPRAVYFSEDTYVGWVQHSNIIEVMTLDEQLGTVFYIFNNAPDAPRHLVRENMRCLVCHDSDAMLGGGVPVLIARTGLYNAHGIGLREITEADDVTDNTPLAERWGGWYVSGQHGNQTHLGNLQLRNAAQITQVDKLSQGNLDSLANADLFDTEPYLRATSDIVALLVLEHQVTVQNAMTYVKFKAPMVLQRTGHGSAAQAESWDALPPKAQTALTAMLDRLVKALLFIDAAPLTDRISGSAEFAAWFQNQGPRDAQGRSLRELDLQTRLFKYPVSYLVLGDYFESLPDYAKDYVYKRLAAHLGGGDSAAAQEQWTQQERSAALDILLATGHDFAPYAGEQPLHDARQ